MLLIMSLNVMFTGYILISHPYKKPSSQMPTVLQHTSRLNFKVCIPYAERPQNASYVDLTLDSLARELSPTEMLHDVVVLDLDGVFRQRSGWASRVLQVRRLDRAMAQCVDDGNDVATGLPCRVEQTNLDVVMALEVCGVEAAKHGKEWILFIEDDVVACDQTLSIVNKTLWSVNASQVAVYRFGKGTQGTAVSAKLYGQLVAKIRQFMQSVPFDVVVTYRDDYGVRLVYNSNLFHHVGDISSVLYRNKRYYIETYGVMRSDVCGQPLS